MAEENKSPKEEESSPQAVEETSSEEELGFDLSEVDLFGDEEGASKEKEAPSPSSSEAKAEAETSAEGEKPEEAAPDPSSGPALDDLPEDLNFSESDSPKEPSSDVKGETSKSPEASKEEETDQGSSKGRRIPLPSFSLKDVALWAGVFFSLLGIISGILVIQRIYHQAKQEPPVMAADQKKSPKESPESTVQPPPKPSPPASPLEQPVVLTYDLPLRTFLLPYRDHAGRYVFVKVSVTLLFDTRRDYLMAKEQEVFLRETVYEIISQIPLYLWQSKEGMATVVKTLKSGLRPQRIRGIRIKDISIMGEIFK